MLDPTCLAPHAVARWAAATPHATALEHVDGSVISYGELDRRARAWASAFADLGIAAGDHVATMLPNTFDAHLTLLALAWLRAVEVPLNVAFTGRMLAYSLDHADVTTLIVAPELRDAVAAIESEVPDLQRVVTLDDATRTGLDRRRHPRSRSRRAAVPRRAFADVHVGHDRPVEGGDHAVGGHVPVLVVGARRHAQAG